MAQWLMISVQLTKSKSSTHFQHVEPIFVKDVAYICQLRRSCNTRRGFSLFVLGPVLPIPKKAHFVLLNSTHMSQIELERHFLFRIQLFLLPQLTIDCLPRSSSATKFPSISSAASLMGSRHSCRSSEEFSSLVSVQTTRHCH
jgi:hypothetical protein